MSLMLLSRLPSVIRWPALLSGAPCWQLNVDALQPTKRPRGRGLAGAIWQGLGASPSGASVATVGRAGAGSHPLSSQRVAGVPCCCCLAAIASHPRWWPSSKSGVWEDRSRNHFAPLCRPEQTRPAGDGRGFHPRSASSVSTVIALAGVGQVAAVAAAAMQGKAGVLRQPAQPGGPAGKVGRRSPFSTGSRQHAVDASLQLMVDTLKGAGWKVAIASGGFTRFAGQLQRGGTGLDAIFANELAGGGSMTGKVSGRIVDVASRPKVLQQLAQEYEHCCHELWPSAVA